MTSLVIGPAPLVTRFWKFVEKSDDCWAWTGGKDSKGYGRLRLGRLHDYRSTGAHRFSYILAHGSIPEGLDLDHLCRVPGCVNPAHLEPVTRGENARRGIGPAGVGFRQEACIRGHALAWERCGKRVRRYCPECRRARDRARAPRRRGGPR